MRSAHFYAPLILREKKAKGHGFVRTFLFAGLLLLMLPSVSRANTPIPTAPGGANQSHDVCGGVPVSLNTWLAAIDGDPTNMDTWSEFVAPSHGTLSGFPHSQSAASSGVPTGLFYTPDDATVTFDDFVINVADDDGNSVNIFIHLNINPGPSLTLGTAVPVCQRVTSTTLPFTALTNVGPGSVSFGYTGGPQSWTVPENVTNVKFDLQGAMGGHDNLSGVGNPGLGGRIQGTLSVTPLLNLAIYVGGAGGDGDITGATGGYNGGGNAQYYFFGSGGAGGGATDIRLGGNTLANRKVVAGGGGGNGFDNSIPLAGGGGGGTIGGNSADNGGGSHASGGSSFAGGAPAVLAGYTPGSAGTSGNGGAGSPQGISGAGGGGYFGGGGGVWTGGGGGSSYADFAYTTAVTHTRGVNAGNGTATINYNIPGTYTLRWDGDANAIANGFNSEANVALPTTSEFTIPVPAAAAAGTYTATLTIDNATCVSPTYTFVVTVKPIPVVGALANQILCHGDSTADVSLSTPTPGSSVYWQSDNAAFFGSLPSSGSGHIGSFAPVNNTPDPAVANITVTAIANGCISDTVTFQITDNPIPALNSLATPPGICNNTLFSYIPTSLTVGTDFTWRRDMMTDIANLANTGADNPNETLNNTGINPVNVAYVYTLTANGCSDTSVVSVQVNPTPVMTSTLTPAAICNNTMFDYIPASSTTGVVFTWTRTAVTGISNATASGSGAIHETLTNTTNLPKTANYVYSMTINGCVKTQNIPVTVAPTPALTSDVSATSICSGALYHYAPSTDVAGAAITWTRPVVTGISPATGSGSNAIDEVLTNNTPAALAVSYIYSMSAYGCTYVQTLNVNVKPSPKLSSTLAPDSVCTNTMFHYTPASLTAGTTFSWTRDNQVGISNTALTGVNGVHEVLYDTTGLPVNVVYNYVLSANGCLDSQNVVVEVNPLPVLSNNVSSLSVCDSTLFTFNPASITPGATFAWTRAYQAGIFNLGASGTGSPNERLDNTTYITVEVPYSYVITAAGCSNTQNIIVGVRPSPILSTPHTAQACANAPFTYVPVSYTPLSTFAWSRAGVTGITPATASGTGSIMDTLRTSATGILSTVYTYTLTVNGTVCTNLQTVTVSVNPAPAAPVIGTHPGATLCGNSTYVNFGADVPAPAGQSYSWTASNATIMSSGNDKQYVVVTFNTPGTAVVTLTTRVGNTTCATSSSYSVTVSQGTAVSPEVIYFQGQFICKLTDVTAYQWGYDNANTLDSAIFAGETNQNYVNTNPDWANYRYWVMTTHGDCKQKTYYNKPTGVANVNVEAGMNVYPNPATNVVNVEISDLVTGNINIEVTNMLGQKLTTVAAVNNKAQISVANLPAGVYLVDCISDGVKIAAARFIKN